MNQNLLLNSWRFAYKVYGVNAASIYFLVLHYIMGSNDYSVFYKLVHCMKFSAFFLSLRNSCSSY